MVKSKVCIISVKRRCDGEGRAGEGNLDGNIY